MGWRRKLWLYFWNFRYLPLNYRLRAIKIRRILLPTGSPWYLRATWRSARTLANPPLPSPALFVLRLIWPFPTWKYPATLPPPPRIIMANPKAVSCQLRDLVTLRSMPLWRSRDTPERSFYRLYEAFCSANGAMMTYETEYFWRRSSSEWATRNIPDPKCDDEEQYAVMASLAEVLVESFMWRLELGLRRDDTPFMNRDEEPKPFVPETCPLWTAKIPALTEDLLIHPEESQYFDSPFHRRNIYMCTGFFYTV